MNNTLLTLWILLLAFICGIALSVFFINSSECEEQGGRYMRSILSTYECVFIRKELVNEN